MPLFVQLPWIPFGAQALLGTVPLLFWLLHRRLKRRQSRQLGASLAQLQLLRGLLADLQRHRGLSTGLLSGDDSLRRELCGVREHLERDFARAKTLGGPAWQALFEQWAALRDGRSQDVAANLTGHHRIIRDCIYLIEDVAGEVDLGEGGQALAYLPTIWREVVQTAEWAGQARALGTGIAANGRSCPEQRVRLRFLHQKIGSLSQTAFEILQRDLPADMAGFRLQQCRQAVQAFLLCVEQELLDRERPQIDAKRYFQQATRAIDELLALVDAALAQLQRLHGEG